MNSMNKVSYNDVYERGRIDINREAFDIDAAIARTAGAENSTTSVVTEQVDVANLPSEDYLQEQTKKKDIGTLDILAWAVSPLAAFGDAAIAPIADTNYPGTGVIDDTAHAFKVSGQAFMKRLLPELGEEQEQYGRKIVDQHFEELPDWAKDTMGVGLELLTDPTFSMSTGLAKTVQAGLKAKKLQAMGEEGLTNKGILEEGLLRLAGFDKGFDPDDLSAMGKLAMKADRGDKKALEELHLAMADDRYAQIANAVDIGETSVKVKYFKEVFGDENAPMVVFKESQDLAKFGKATKDTKAVITTAKGSEYYWDGVSTIRDASKHAEAPVEGLGKKSKTSLFVYPQEIPTLLKWQKLDDPGKRITLDEVNNVAVLHATDAQGNRVKVGEVALSKTPVRKMAPLEFFGSDRAGSYYKNAHLGSEIVSVAPRAEGAFTDNGIPAFIENVNLRKFDGPGSVDAFLYTIGEHIAPILQKAKGNPHDEQFMRAGVQKQLLGELLARPVDRLNDVEALSLRVGLLATAKEFKKYAAMARDETGKVVDPISEAAAGKAFILNAMLLEKVSGAATAAGRNLRSFQLRPDQFSIRGMHKQIDNLLEESNFKDTHFMRVMKSLAADNRLDDAGLQRFMDKSFRTFGDKMWDASLKTYDVAYEIFVNAFLSGPLTHAANIVSSSAMLLLTPTRQYMEALSSGARGFIMGDDMAKVKFDADMKQAHALMAGLMGGTADAFRLASSRFTDNLGLTMGRTEALKARIKYPEELERMHEYAKHRINPKISSENLGLSGRWGQIVDFVGGVTRMPGEALMQEDKAFKLINYRMGINQEAAKRAFYTGKNQADQKAIYNMLVNNPDEFMESKAVDMALVNTFQQKLGEFGSKWEWVFRTPGMNLITPFFRTPVNIAKFGVRNSVFGNVFKDLTPALTEMNAKGDTARANLAIGTMIPAMVLSMLPDDMVTTGVVDMSTEKGRLKASQEPPYSFIFKYEDGSSRSISFEKIEPFRSMIGMMVNYRDVFQATYKEYKDGTLWDDEESDNVFWEATTTVIAPFLQTIKTTPFFDFVGELANILRSLMNGDPDIAQEQLMNMAAGMAMPNFVNQINKTEFDNTMRMAETFMDKIKQRCWGLSTDMPIRPNVFGDPQYAPRGVPFAVVNPFLTKRIESDIIAKEMIRVGVNVPKLPNEFTEQGVKLKLDIAKKSQFGVLVGKGFTDPYTGEKMPALRDQIKAVLAADDLKGLKEGEFKDSIIKSRVEFTIQARRKAVQAYMIDTIPELKEKFTKVKQEQELAAQAATVE